MPDTKITALTALTAADPANDMMPIVDVSDTSMAASGTTKRISINNILACSPSATLASLNVTGSSIPANGLYLPTTNTLEFSANSLAQYRIAPLGVFSWYDGAGGTRMTLNSTGLGVGGSPTASKLEVYSSNTGTSGLAEANALKVENNNATVGNAAGLFLSQSGNAGCGVAAIATSRTGGSRASALALYYYNQATSASPIEGARLNASGNLLAGVTSDLVSPSRRLSVSGTVAATLQSTGAATVEAVNVWHTAATGDNKFIEFDTEASITARGSITYNRAGGLVAYNTTSDYRAKDIIGPVSNSGSVIDSLKVYIGKMKGATVERPMLVAHEAQEFAPYSVTGQKDEVDADGNPKYQQMDVSSFVPLLIAEIQSLRARVQTLEAK